jgi:hypothetical protein
VLGLDLSVLALGIRPCLCLLRSLDRTGLPQVTRLLFVKIGRSLVRPERVAMGVSGSGLSLIQTPTSSDGIAQTECSTLPDPLARLGNPSTCAGRPRSRCGQTTLDLFGIETPSQMRVVYPPGATPNRATAAFIEGQPLVQ